MLVLPIRNGEVTTITAPNGDRIQVLLTAHRSSLDEPLLGFEAPAGYTVLRDRIIERMQSALESISLYRVSCLAGRDEVIAAYRAEGAVDLYRKRYPGSSNIKLSRIDPIVEHQWHARLIHWLLLRMEPPFVVELGD